MPRATLQDVAAKANVSRTTASLILNSKNIRVSEETRNRVWAIARELHYTPNALIRSLQTQSTRTLGVYFGVGDDMLNKYIGTIFNAIRSEAEKWGYDILIHGMGRSGQEIEISKFLDGRNDGLLFWQGERTINYENLAGTGLPVVVLLSDPQVPDLSSLVFDDRKGMEWSIGHLLELGHRRIAYIGGNSEVPHLYQRKRQFEEALKTFSSDHVEADILMDEQADPQFLTPFLTGSKRPTAVISAYDEITLDCLEIAEAAGIRVPHELSLINWEGVLYPLDRFTSISHDINMLGRKAVQTLIGKINGIKTEDKQVFDVQFVQGKTTGTWGG
jgi:LacI family transcriptional regulator